MRNSRRRLWAAMLARVSRLSIAAGTAVLAFLLGAVGAEAREVTVRGAAMTNFGRIGLEFDKPTKIGMRIANGVLVISFPEPVAIRAEKLVSELPSYISTVRRDPDGTGIRLALTNNFRPNLLEAGEHVFIDLLPQNWTGLPPALPQEVVADLARRVSEAEAKVVADVRQRSSEAPKPIAVRIAQLPTLTRAVFTPPKLVPISFRANGNEVELQFDAPLSLETGKLKAQLSPAIRAISAQSAGASLVVRITVEPGYEARGFREDETFVLDFAKPKPASRTADQPKPAPEASAAADPDRASGSPAREAPPASAAGTPASAAGTPASAAGTPASAAGTPASAAGTPASAAGTPALAVPPARAQTAGAAPASSGPVRSAVAVSPDGLKITFPFVSPTAAAAFERAGIATLVFQTADPIELAALPADALRYASGAEVTREGPLAIVRLTLVDPQLSRLAPEGDRWVLTIGDKGLVPSEPLNVSRRMDEKGRTGVLVPLTEVAGIHWIKDLQSGERLAVVTAFAPARGLPKPQTFVEFRLLPTAHGVVVAPEADDLAVLSAPGGVSIGRESGLAVSLSSPPAEPDFPIQPSGTLLISREAWKADQLGDVLQRHRDLLRAVAEAPRPAVSRARLELAQFLVAVGMDAEARSILDFAFDQDPALARQTGAALLRGVAALGLNRLTEARKFLSTDTLQEDQEGILWRAVLDAREKHWAQALLGFRRSNLLLDLYPDDLQGVMRLLAARAAIEAQDQGYAENELAALGQLPAGSFSSQEAALMRARLDEANGKLESAGDLYRKLAADAERPVAAAATLRWVPLAIRTGAMTREDAIAQLETLSLIWRGDDIEIETIGQLGRLYAETGHWREAFTMAARANRLFPDHEVSRTLHEETGRLFEELFLSGKGETLSRVDALALYFDFKQFTPIGRRGDEIVRRLADRLVELDLLEQASELLQYQVERRLTGAARATVAARLASIRLMDNKPALALGALQATKLPELPASIKRARMLLEARALSDLSRTELAIETLNEETGPEIDRLRADIYWTGRRWREAGEAHEHLAGTRWQGPEPLSDRDRTDVLRAAVAYALGNEQLALDRLRAKFAAKMAATEDARTFAFLTRPNIANTRPFRDIARSVTSADTLADFLAEYRKRYPEAAAADRRRQSKPDPAPATEAPGKPQAQRSPAEPAAPNG